MAKANRNKEAPATQTTEQAAAAPKRTPGVREPKQPGVRDGGKTIVVNSEYPGHKHKGARGDFYRLLLDFDGKPKSAMAEEFAKTPPKIQKGTTAYGSFEAWFTWFARQGGVSLK